MRKLHFLLILLASVLFQACLDDDEDDREKLVDMIVYPETGYGSDLFSDVWTERVIFSESDNPTKRTLSHTITEGFDFEYRKGYQYWLKVKKVWMKNPPQDVSSIKYVFVELVEVEKVVTRDCEVLMELYVAPGTVPFTPSFPCEFDKDGMRVIYDALKVKETESNNWMALVGIDGFQFESGYEYVLSVKKRIEAEPYRESYVLRKVVSKEAER